MVKKIKISSNDGENRITCKHFFVHQNSLLFNVQRGALNNQKKLRLTARVLGKKGD